MALPKDAKARKEVPLYSGVHRYFPAALQGVAKVSLNGSRQHHGTDELYDDRSKSNDDLDCALRHLEDAFIGDGMDGEVAHVDKAAWRVLRVAQKWHEERGAGIAPAAANVAKAARQRIEAACRDMQNRNGPLGRISAYDAHIGFGGFPISEDAE